MQTHGSSAARVASGHWEFFLRLSRLTTEPRTLTQKEARADMISRRLARGGFRTVKLAPATHGRGCSASI
jgi:hypothetical protein